MATKTYTCTEVSVNYDAMVDLRRRGQLNLGLDKMLASKLSAMGFASSSSEIRGLRSAYHFFTWVPVAAFAWTIYLSFTSSWWWFIYGLLGMVFVQQVNLRSNAQNICDAAYRDPLLYKELKDRGVWRYQIQESVARQLERA